MRSFIIALSILFGIFCWLIGSYLVLENLSKENCKKMNIVLTLIENEHWERALNEFEIERNEFCSNEWVYSALVDHAEMDSIESSLIATEQYIRTQSKPAALEAAARAIFLLEHIEEKNRFNWENVL